ncbi:MAG: hypothetical protein KZQ95_09125 [Candidatus Thiodiazotropha sp. (ex Epidulcina cf. delphinae)]|nr:hypothetical protein [Candidatus Thiodiazotropha sp. (ex Epidulcina cf. delphinae)]
MSCSAAWSDVGGGASGLELAIHPGGWLGKRGRAEVTLIDAARTHIWKSLLHTAVSQIVAVNSVT